MFVGGCARDTNVSVSTERVHYEEVTLKGSYHHTPDAGLVPYGLMVLTTADGMIATITGFRDTTLFPAFALPAQVFSR